MTKDYTVSLLYGQQYVVGGLQPTGGQEYDQGLCGQPARKQCAGGRDINLQEGRWIDQGLCGQPAIKQCAGRQEFNLQEGGLSDLGLGGQPASMQYTGGQDNNLQVQLSCG